MAYEPCRLVPRGTLGVLQGTRGEEGASPGPTAQVPPQAPHLLYAGL